MASSPAPEEHGVLTLRGAAAFLKVHPNTIRTQVRRGLLPGAKVGRDWRFLEADLIAWMRLGYPQPGGRRSRVQEVSRCPSDGAEDFIASTSQSAAERALDALLEPGKGKRRRREAVAEDPAS
jgi:excisionase family DNA binding protein